MRTIITLFIFISTGIFSCSQSQKNKIPEQQTPKALQDNSAEISIVSKRGPDDLVKSLYAELVEKTPGIKEFEKILNSLKDEKPDSLSLFLNYHQKNESYYDAAALYFNNIKDSVLRDKMKTLISRSLADYKEKIKVHQNLISSIDTRAATLDDLHAALQLVKTLPLIEKYQEVNIPAIQPLEIIKNKFDNTINKADSLVLN
jgi:hypothetical protein